MKAKKKILYFIPSDIVGGAEVQTALLCKHLDKTRFEVAVATIPLHPSYYGFVTDLRPHLSRYAEVADFRQLANFIKSYQPDLIQYGHSFWPTDALGQVPGWKGRVVEVVHGRHAWDRDATKVSKLFTNHIVSVSQDAQDFFLGVHPDWKDRATIIPNGIDLNKYPLEAGGVGARNLPGTVFLHVGRLCECDKRQTRMIELCKLLPRGSWQLNLVGDGADKDRIAAAARTAPPGHVWLAGFTADPIPYYYGADIYLSRSEAEGFALNIAEAAACGMPIVMWDCGGISRYFTHGVDAFVVKSEQDFLDAMIKLMNEPELRITMGAKARELVFKEFSAQKMAARYEDLYAGMLGMPSRAPKSAIEEIIAVEDKKFVEALEVAAKPPRDILGISNPNWKGVTHATQAWVGNNWLGVDHSQIRETVAGAILARKPDILILGGDSGYLPICKLVKKHAPKTKIILTWHSYPSAHSFLPGDANLFAQWVQTLDDGIIDRIGFVRPRFHKIFNDKRFVYFPNRTPQVTPIPEGYRPGVFGMLKGPHFGSISTSAIWKNIEGTLLIAGKHKSNPVVHVTKTETAPLLKKLGIRFMEHSYQDKAAFHRLLASMDLNLLLSFGEAYNMTFMESWMLGVPCITSATTDLHPDLEFTRVRSYDDAVEIWTKIDWILENPQVEKVKAVLKALDDDAIVVTNKVLGEL